MIDEAASRRTLRHAALGMVIELGLAEGQPAMLLDRRDAERAIAAEPGQDDADGVLALVLRQRGEKRVDRDAAGRGRRWTSEMQGAASDRQDGVRWNDIDLVRADLHRVLDEVHRHRGVAGDDRDQGALIVGIKVLNQHEGHASVGWHLREERFEGVDTARRGAEANDQPGSIRHNGGRSGSLPLGIRRLSTLIRAIAALARFTGASWHCAPWE